MKRIILCLVLSAFLLPSLAHSEPDRRSAHARKPVLRRLASVLFNGKQRARLQHKLLLGRKLSTAKRVLGQEKLSVADLRTILRATKAWKNPNDIVQVQHGGWSYTYYTQEYRNGDPSAPAHKVLKRRFGTKIASQLMENDVTTPRGFSYAQVKRGPSNGSSSQIDAQALIVGVGAIAGGLLTLALCL